MAGDECRRYPYDIKDVTEEEKQKMPTSVRSTLRDNDKWDMCYCGPNRILLPGKIKKYCWDIYNFEPRKDDVWLFGFPRSGTTLTQEILWLIGNDLNFEKAAKDVLDIRFPIIHTSVYLDGNILKDKAIQAQADAEVLEIANKYTTLGIQKFIDTKERRFLKSHMPPSLLSPKLITSGAKIVFAVRNPKDTIVSNYHIYKFFGLNNKQEMSMEDFVQLFINDFIIFTPYFEQIKEFWALRNHKNCLFLFYEDTRKDLRGTLKRVANFLDKKLTEQDLNKLEDHLAIDNFRKNKTVNNDHFIKIGMATDNQQHQFIRKGETGGWTKYFTNELNEKVDKWIADNLKGTDIVFPE